MIMIIINETRVSLFDYTIMKFIVTKISRIVQFFVVSKKISYFLIFKRSWLRNVVVIEYYESNEYWIKDLNDNYNMLKIFDQRFIRVTEMYLKKCCLTSIISRENISVDDEILIDLDYLKDERTNAIIHEIKQKTQAKMKKNFKKKNWKQWRIYENDEMNIKKKTIKDSTLWTLWEQRRIITRKEKISTKIRVRSAKANAMSIKIRKKIQKER